MANIDMVADRPVWCNILLKWIMELWLLKYIKSLEFFFESSMRSKYLILIQIQIYGKYRLWVWWPTDLRDAILCKTWTKKNRLSKDTKWLDSLEGSLGSEGPILIPILPVASFGGDCSIYACCMFVSPLCWKSFRKKNQKSNFPEF